MKENLTFVTIFPEIEDVHLIKDVGMIPWAMAHEQGYDSKILVPSKAAFPRAGEVPDLQLVPVKRIFKHHTLNCYIWLMQNARKIDVLHFFHQVKHTRISIAIYKRLNPKGLVYVHLDCDGTDYGQYTLGLEGNSIKKKIKRWIYHHIFYPKKFQKDIFWGTQNKAAAENIVGKFPYQNVAYVPDGIRMEKQETPVLYENKKNVLLTVGRNGTAQKRTDVLLEAFAKAAPQIEGWELRIVGSIEPSFQSYLTEYFTLHPELKDRVFFVGEVQEKAALQQEYAQAKIFCLPSDWESFGIVNVEAMAAGCTVITTDYPAARDIVDGERYGRIIPFGDSEALAQKMIELCHNTAYLKNNCEVVQKYAYEQFSYDVITDIIHKWIKNKLDQSGKGDRNGYKV